MIREIIIYFFVLLLSTLWYVWLRRALQSQKARNFTTEPFEEGQNIVKDSLSSLRMSIEQLLAFKGQFALTSEVISKIKDKEDNADKQIAIERNLRIYYKNIIYINEIFCLDVNIGKEGEVLISLTEEEERELNISKSERLKFEAFEPDPLVQVELKFADGDFGANKTKETKKLKKTEETKYSFLLKPLKAEECILTVAISYVSSVPVPDTIIEKVTIKKKITPEGGPDTIEETEQATIKPESAETMVVEVKTIDLRISVKIIFGRNAREIEFAQKALSPVVAAILLGVALYTGLIERQVFLNGMILSVVNAVGIPVLDEVKERIF